MFFPTTGVLADTQIAAWRCIKGDIVLCSQLAGRSFREYLS